MNPPVLTFFNNKGGVGKTSLVYHIAWAFSMLQKRVIVADFDPQANLTGAFLNEDEIDDLWNLPGRISTIYQCVAPLAEVGDICSPQLLDISDNLFLLPGDVQLSQFEDTLADAWPRSLNTSSLYRPMRILSAFWQVIMLAVEQKNADVVIVDAGPNLGAINRSVLIATDYVAIPLAADLFSLQGLKNLGPTLSNWRENWVKRRDNWAGNSESKKYDNFQLPSGAMSPIGYLCQQYGVRLDRPVQAYDKWINRIPAEYRRHMMEDPTDYKLPPKDDPYCLATLKHYRSLIPLAQEHKKPIFMLNSADGATGAHATAAQKAKTDFLRLAEEIAAKMKINVQEE